MCKALPNFCRLAYLPAVTALESRVGSDSMEWFLMFCLAVIANLLPALMAGHRKPAAPVA